MAKPVVVWTEAQGFRWVELQEGTPAELGRDPAAHIKISHTTVSRKHARFIDRGGKVYIENLSQTNPTRVNQVVVQRPTALSDGDLLHVGMVNVVFHDLSSADRAVGLVCGNCSRENQASDKDCWYCGTSLVNAPTIVAKRLPVVCRFVSRTGSIDNLYPGEVYSVSASGDGSVQKSEGVPEGAAAVVTPQDGKPMLASVSEETPILLNGAVASGIRQLRTGDELSLGQGHFLFIRR